MLKTLKPSSLPKKRPSRRVGIPLLKFLWKWKYLTTTALALRFYPNAQAKSGYVKLRDLENWGYIRSVNCLVGRGNVWKLTKKGFRLIQNELPPIECSYRTYGSIAPEILAPAAMLGEWITQEPSGVELYSAHQLRSTHHDKFPLWVPQSNYHLADGYWKMPMLGENASIALELEWYRHPVKEIPDIAGFYERYAFVKHVFWILNMPFRTCAISRKISQYQDGNLSKHNFIDINVFMKLGWRAPIKLGEFKGKTISEVMGTISQLSPALVNSAALLETLKCPKTLNPSVISENHTFFN